MSEPTMNDVAMWVAHELSEVLDDSSGLYPAGVQIIAAALAAEREKTRARYEEWLTELHQNDANGYCVECERPTPNGCTTMLELPRIRRAAEEGQQ